MPGSNGISLVCTRHRLAEVPEQPSRRAHAVLASEVFDRWAAGTLLDHGEQLVVLLDTAGGALGDVGERRTAGRFEQCPLTFEDRQQMAVGAGLEQDLVEAPVEAREARGI